MSIQIFWDTHEDVEIDGKNVNLIIGDVPQKWHERVTNYMIENFFRPHKLFHELKWPENPQTEEDYRAVVKHVLKGECSILVVDEETNVIYGVALMMWMTKEWRSWTMLDQVVQRGMFTEFYDMQRKEVLDSAKKHPDEPFDSLHVFDYYLYPQLRNNWDFLKKFFDAICNCARHMNMPRVTFLGRTYQEQEEIDYHEWTNISSLIYALCIIEGRRPFITLRNIDEMYAILYEQKVMPLTPFYNMLPAMPYDAHDRDQHELPRTPILAEIFERMSKIPEMISKKSLGRL